MDNDYVQEINFGDGIIADGNGSIIGCYKIRTEDEIAEVEKQIERIERAIEEGLRLAQVTEEGIKENGDEETIEGEGDEGSDSEERNLTKHNEMQKDIVESNNIEDDNTDMNDIDIPQTEVGYIDEEDIEEVDMEEQDVLDKNIKEKAKLYQPENNAIEDYVCNDEEHSEDFCLIKYQDALDKDKMTENMRHLKEDHDE